MKTTIEISNYPLSEDYEVRIVDFIKRCQAYNFTTKVTATSTQITGDYDQVMQMLQSEMKSSFEKYGKMIFVVKFLYGELDLDIQM